MVVLATAPATAPAARDVIILLCRGIYMNKRKLQLCNHHNYAQQTLWVPESKLSTVWNSVHCISFATHFLNDIQFSSNLIEFLTHMKKLVCLIKYIKNLIIFITNTVWELDDNYMTVSVHVCHQSWSWMIPLSAIYIWWHVNSESVVNCQQMCLKPRLKSELFQKLVGQLCYLKTVSHFNFWLSLSLSLSLSHSCWLI